MRWTWALLALALAMSGCESTAEKSAQLAKQAKHINLGSTRGLAIAKPSRYVKVLGAQVMAGREGSAAVITLRSTSSKPLRDVPIAITVRGAHGKVTFQNNAPGLEAGLTSMALLEPGQQSVWVNDQVQGSEAPTSVSAVVGESQPASGVLPQLRIVGAQPVAGSGSAAAGTLTNDSAIAQSNLVVYAIARRGGRIVGAGRAIIPEVGAHGSSRFEVSFVGQIQGARLQFSAPPTMLG